MKGEVHWVRYLDDFVICFQYKGDAQRLHNTLPKRLAKFGLTLESTKTRMVEFGRFTRLNSKRYGRKLETIYFLRFSIFGGLCKIGDLVLCFKTEKGRLNQAHSKIIETVTNFRHFPLGTKSRELTYFIEVTTDAMA